MEQTAQRENLAPRLRTALRTPGAAGGDLALTAALGNAHEADIAEALRDLTNPEALAIFNWLDNARAAAVLGQLESDTARYILANAPPYRIADLLDRLPMDDAAWVVSEAEPDRAQIFMSVLQARAPQDAEEVKELLTYAEDTAGRLMTDTFIRLRDDMTVEEAIRHVRAADSEVETVSDLYVVEVVPNRTPRQGNEKLVGILSLRDLLRARDDQCVSELMEREIMTTDVDTDQEEVARLIRKYDFLAMPILDRNGYLAGIVTVDDILDVLTEEGTEDALRFGGVATDEAGRSYFSTPLWEMVKSRVGWLALLFVGGSITSSVIGYFESDLVKVAALTAFIPLLIGAGGNTGAQTVATMIRGLSLQEIRPADISRVLAREFVSGLLLGSLLAVIGFGQALLWTQGDVKLAVVVALAVLAICTWSNTIGSIIPLVAQRVGVDPAMVSAPLITTLVDATGLAIYLLIARALLAAL